MADSVEIQFVDETVSIKNQVSAVFHSRAIRRSGSHKHGDAKFCY